MEGTNNISERLSALSDFLTDEGFYPECYENRFVFFFYYGAEICIIPDEDERDMYVLHHKAHVNKEILRNDWDRFSGWMYEFPMIQVIRGEYEDDSLLWIDAYVYTGINDREKFRSMLYPRLEAICICRMELAEIYGSIGPDVQMSFATQCMKDTGYCPEVIDQNGIRFTYSDIDFQVWLYHWGFSVQLSEPADEFGNDSEKLIQDISKLMQLGNYKCTLHEYDKGKQGLVFSYEIYYSYKEWGNASYFLKQLETAVICIVEAFTFLGRISESSDHSEDFNPLTFVEGACIPESEYNDNLQFIFNSLKHYGYQPDVNGPLLHAVIKGIDFNIAPAENTSNYYIVFAARKLEEKSDVKYISEVAMESMKKGFGQCYIQKGDDGDELWFKSLAEIPENRDDEKFFFQFEPQVRHLYDMIVEVDECTSDEDTNDEIPDESSGADEEIMRIFKYLKDAGLCGLKPEGNAIVYTLNGRSRYFVIHEYGYFIFQDSWAIPEKHHTFENEAEAANDVLVDAYEPIQIYRVDDGEEHGMRFSWFFDEFPTNDAEEFIGGIKEVAEVLDDYENKFIKRLEEIENHAE